MKLLAGVMAISALLLAVPTSYVAQASQVKLSVCHVTDKATEEGHFIVISSHAQSAHRAHGDCDFSKKLDRSGPCSCQ